jgi:hypothetical protein
MDASTQAWLMPVIVFAFGLFAAGMYCYRKYSAGESFDAAKFLQTMGLGGLAALVLYVASAAVPDVDTIIKQIELLAPGGVPSMSVILAALLAVWNGLSKKVTETTATVSTAATQAATTEQAKASLATAPVTSEVTGTTASYAAGKATFLGIYANSVSGGTPTPSLTFDVNQIPEIIAEVMTLVTGKLVCSVKIDGQPLKDCQEITLNLTEVGKKNWLPMWIPQAYRTAGTHILTIQTGHLEGAENITTGGTDSKIVYDGAVDYSLVLTGTKKE